MLKTTTHAFLLQAAGFHKEMERLLNDGANSADRVFPGSGMSARFWAFYHRNCADMLDPKTNLGVVNGGRVLKGTPREGHLRLVVGA